jgi:hypothetical protein
MISVVNSIDNVMRCSQKGKLLNQNRGTSIWRTLALCIINNAFEFRSDMCQFVHS